MFPSDSRATTIPHEEGGRSCVRERQKIIGNLAVICGSPLNVFTFNRAFTLCPNRWILSAPDLRPNQP